MVGVATTESAGSSGECQSCGRDRERLVSLSFQRRGRCWPAVAVSAKPVAQAGTDSAIIGPMAKTRDRRRVRRLGPRHYDLGAAFIAFALMLAACGDANAELPSSLAVHVEAAPCGRESNGSGFAVGDDLVLTNAHLVAGSIDDVGVRTGSGRLIPATVVGFDAVRDLALLRAHGVVADPVRFAEVSEGSKVSIVARPHDSNLQRLEAVVVREFNATGDDIYGEGDARRRAVELKVDVPPGVSGAGVYSADGGLIGVIFAESIRKDDSAYAVAGVEVELFLEESDPSSVADTLKCREP